MNDTKKRKHIGVAVFGTYGDIAPLAIIAEALGARGHRVTFWVNPTFHQIAAEALKAHPEVTIVSAGAAWSLQEALARPGALDPRHVWRDVYMPQVRPFFEAIGQTHRVAPLDIVLAHSWTIGAFLACMAMRIPFGCASLQPMMWMSTIEPPRLDALYLPLTMRRPIQRLILPALYKLYFAPALIGAASEVGIDLGGVEGLPFAHFWSHARFHLGLWDKHFRGPQADDPPHSQIIGFPQHACDEPLTAELFEFCQRHRPWVMGLGSALPVYHQDQYQHLIDATQAPLVIVGARPERLRNLGERVFVVERAPFSTLFGLSRGVIHHGGIGTSAEALAAGVPQGVMPFGNDMFDNAERLEALGVARCCPAHKVSVTRLRRQLKELEDERIITQAREIARALRRPEQVIDDAISIILRD